MRLYLLTSKMPLNYDTYDSMVIAAESANRAKDISILKFSSNWQWPTSRTEIISECISAFSKYQKETIVITSYNAG